MANPITATDYKASDIQGKQRICGGKFGNQLGGTPWVTMDEELVTYDATTDILYRNPVGSCQTSLSNPARELPLRSPADDTSIALDAFISKLQGQGHVTDEDFYLIFYSLGRRTQLTRDAYLAAQRAQATAQAAYDADQNEANLAALNAAIAATEAARGEM